MKPRVGPANDPLEHEADRVAEAVVAGRPIGAISSANSNTPQRKCSECAEDEERTLQRKETGEAAVPSQAIDAAARAVSHGGNSLSPEQRAYFEPRFGRDLSGVRLHRDHAAASAARNINARAFTLGNHVALAPDATRSEGDGELVLAHELAHVIQQSGQAGTLQRWASCTEANISGMDCPPRQAEDAQRARAEMVFFSGMRDVESEHSGALIANFDIDKATIKPSLAATLDWQKFLELTAQEKTKWRLVGFSDCHESGGAKLRGDRAQAVRRAIPTALQPQILSADAAGEGECMRGNVTGADRTMNRSVAFVLEQYTLDFAGDEENDVIVGKTPQDRLRECEAGARVKTFPFRTTRFGGAPIMAHEEGGMIVVKLPMHVKWNGDFRKEVDTLPSDTFLQGTELQKDEIVRVRHYELKHWYNFNVTGDASDDKTTDYCVTGEKMLDFAHATNVAFAVNVVATTVDALMIGTPVGKAVGTGVSKLTAPLTNLAKSGLQKTVLAGATVLSDVVPEVAGSRITTSLVEGRASSAIIENQIADQAVTRSIASAAGEPLAENLTSSALASTAPRLGSSFAGDFLPGFGLAGATEFGSSAIKQTWQDFLPEAQKRLDASKAQRGIPDYMEGMAAPGGPPGPVNANRAIIESLARERSLDVGEMETFIDLLYAEYPLLGELTEAQGLAGAQQYTEMLQILDRFTVQTGVEVEVVEDGLVQAATRQGNFASLRSREGFLQIERSAYESQTLLGREVTHELSFYYARSGGSTPTLNYTYNALDVLERTIQNGGVFPFGGP